tara:strand:+ start:285 stop:533 length:249 start_codon:yes stop_codon:yes gene_type:complete
MFKWFGGKQAEAPASEWTVEHKMISLKNDASALKMEIEKAQHTLNSVLETTARATKDERTIIVTSSLQTLTKVHAFLSKVVR